MATLALSLAGSVVGGVLGGPFGATVGRALGALAGSAVDAALFGEQPTTTSGRDIRLTGSSAGGVVPRAWGWNRLSGNISGPPSSNARPERAAAAKAFRRTLAALT
jgi:hypothetical protein